MRQEPQTGPTTAPSSEMRARIARQVREFRTRERANKIQDERDLVQYAIDLRGLGATIDYVSTFGRSKKILDIGVGQGNALIDLVSLPEHKGLTFEGTGLIAPSAINALEPAARPTIYLTPAELLKGAEGPYDAIISDFGLGYSEPSLSMKRVDQLLAPGGIVKFSCTVERLKGGGHNVGLRAPSEFVEELQKLGYSSENIFVVEIPEGKDRTNNTEHAIVIAVKSGGVMPLTAKEAYERDIKSVDEGGF